MELQNNLMNSDPKMTPKAGWKTSEFWITIGIQIIPWIQTFEGKMKPEYAAIVSVAAQAFYAWARVKTKTKTIKNGE